MTFQQKNMSSSPGRDWAADFYISICHKDCERFSQRRSAICFFSPPASNALRWKLLGSGKKEATSVQMKSALSSVCRQWLGWFFFSQEVEGEGLSNRGMSTVVLHVDINQKRITTYLIQEGAEPGLPPMFPLSHGVL